MTKAKHEVPEEVKKNRLGFFRDETGEIQFAHYVDKRYVQTGSNLLCWQRMFA